MRTFWAAVGILTLGWVPAWADTPVNGSLPATQTTWTVAGSPYVCTTADVVVDAGKTLVIEPGVTVRFASGRRLLVGGRLEAGALSAARVVFTSTSATPSAGAWGGLVFQNAATGFLRSCDVNGAGDGVRAVALGTATGATAAGFQMALSDVRVTNSSGFGFEVHTNLQRPHTVSLQGCTVRNASLGGLNLQRTSTTDDIRITNNDFGQNGGVPVQATLSALAPLGAGVDRFAGNLPDNTFYLRGVTESLGRDVTLWGRVTGLSGAALNIEADGALRVQSGATVTLPANGGITVLGTLTAAGTEQAPARFVAASGAAGGWDGIRYEEGASGSLVNAEIAHAGITVDSAAVAVEHGRIHDAPAFGVLYRNVGAAPRAFSVKNTDIRAIASGNAAAPAAAIRIETAPAGDTAALTGNTFAANDRNIEVAAAALHVFNGGPDAVAGNTSDAVWVTGGTEAALGNGTRVWERLQTRDTLSVPQGATATFEAGSGLEAGSGAAVRVSGVLRVLGAAGQPVRFTGMGGAPGAWSGLQFQPGATGTLQFARVAHGGASGTANITVDSATVSVASCAIVQSAAAGLRLRQTAPIPTNVTVTASAIHANAGPGVDDTVTESGARVLGGENSGNDITDNGGAERFAVKAVADLVEASFNYWGTETGPCLPADGSGCTGPRVTDHVNVLPSQPAPRTVAQAVLEPVTGRVGGTVRLVGSAQSPLMDRWTLSYRPYDSNAAWTPFHTGTFNIINGTLADWNTAGMDPTIRYSVLLVVTDLAGREVSSVIVTSSPLGDVTGNGRVDLADAVLALRFAHGSSQPTEGQRRVADVWPRNAPDGVITVADVQAIFRVAAGLDRFV